MLNAEQGSTKACRLFSDDNEPLIRRLLGITAYPNKSEYNMKIQENGKYEFKLNITNTAHSTSLNSVKPLIPIYRIVDGSTNTITEIVNSISDIMNNFGVEHFNLKSDRGALYFSYNERKYYLN